MLLFSDQFMYVPLPNLATTVYVPRLLMKNPSRLAILNVYFYFFPSSSSSSAFLPAHVHTALT